MDLKFEPYSKSNDLMGLYITENYDVYRFKDSTCKILFSITRKGNAAFVHMATNKKGLRKLRTAIGDFMNFIFWFYGWCEMILVNLFKKSLMRILRDYGFKRIHEFNDPKNHEVWCKWR